MLKRPRSRLPKRGAVFVEAIVVISFSILCFLGVIYFRELYVKKMRLQRVARASAMAHAMGACQGDPAGGLQADLPTAPLDRGTRQGTPQDLKLGGDKGADALKGIARTSGGTPLNEVTTITLTTSVAATTKKDQQSPSTGFVTDKLSATSYVSCGDEVSNGRYEEIFPRVFGILGSLF